MNWGCKRLERAVPWTVVLAQRQRRLLALHRPHRSAGLVWPAHKHNLMLGHILLIKLVIPPTEADLSNPYTIIVCKVNHVMINSSGS